MRGGRQLADGATEFVAQENCKSNLEATPDPDVVVPTRTYTDQTSIDAGNVSLDLYYFGQSYGTCLSVMIFKPANIMLDGRGQVRITDFDLFLVSPELNQNGSPNGARLDADL